jgi:hypothetical protein
MYIEIIDVEVKYIYTKINIILNVHGYCERKTKEIGDVRSQNPKPLSSID